jgi:hypothetical protein
MMIEEEEGLGVFASLAWMFKGWNVGRVASKKNKQTIHHHQTHTNHHDRFNSLRCESFRGRG